jgi:hypothetical protein
MSTQCFWSRGTNNILKLSISATNLAESYVHIIGTICAECAVCGFCRVRHLGLVPSWHFGNSHLKASLVPLASSWLFFLLKRTKKYFKSMQCLAVDGLFASWFCPQNWIICTYYWSDVNVLVLCEYYVHNILLICTFGNCCAFFASCFCLQKWILCTYYW